MVTYCKRKIPLSGYSKFSRNDIVCIPQYDEIDQAVQDEHKKYMGHCKIIIYIYRLEQVRPLKARTFALKVANLHTSKCHGSVVEDTDRHTSWCVDIIYFHHHQQIWYIRQEEKYHSSCCSSIGCKI